MGEGSDDGLSVVFLGAGCFWCCEACMQRVAGVRSAISGYMGGHVSRCSVKSVLNEASSFTVADTFPVLATRWRIPLTNRSSRRLLVMRNACAWRTIHRWYTCQAPHTASP